MQVLDIKEIHGYHDELGLSLFKDEVINALPVAFAVQNKEEIKEKTKTQSKTKSKEKALV